MKTYFTKKIIEWHRNQNKRIMPWKGQSDPYKIWISEIILQQTRVAQGISYYNNFIQAFPTLEALAKADDGAVFKLWEGLGYYSRCKNLLFTARHVFYELEGKFPQTYEGLLLLKGIGPYTAAAIASFAFNLPHAVVDGNVFRVLSRFLGDFTPIDSNEGKKRFTQQANLLLDNEYPGIYNQAIMDFGAEVCKPVPDCNRCPLHSKCKAFQNNWINHLPVKSKLPDKKKRWLYYFIFKWQDKYLVKKRTEKGIWQNLHEFYLVETERETKWTAKKINNWLINEFELTEFKTSYISPEFYQTLTHQQLHGNFIGIHLPEQSINLPQMKWVKQDKMNELAFPKFINQFMNSRDFI